MGKGDRVEREREIGKEEKIKNWKKKSTISFWEPAQLTEMDGRATWNIVRKFRGEIEL